MKKAKILLIRSKNDAEYTGARFRKIGFQVVSIPLQEIIYHDCLWQPQNNLPYLIMTSKNAVYATYQRLNQLSNGRCWHIYVVGSKTADNIYSHIKNYKIEYLSPNVATLIRYMQNHWDKLVDYHYFRGRHQKINLVGALQGLGFKNVCDSIVYNDIPMEDNYIVIKELFAQSDSLLYVMLYSSRNANRLISILTDQNMQSRPHANLIAICISDDVAACCLKATNIFMQVIVASEPNENAMVKVLMAKTK